MEVMEDGVAVVVVDTGTDMAMDMVDMDGENAKIIKKKQINNWQNSIIVEINL